MAPADPREQVRAFYDRVGAKQDSQAFYEDAATADLILNAELGTARAVFEFGCGTGRFAEKLLAKHLPAECSYLGVDVSSTMVELARDRLGPWSNRARVNRSSGSVGIEAHDKSCDRFVTTYVLDLLADDDIRGLLAEAHRVLRPHGLLCLANLAHGTTPFSRIVTRVWKRIHAWRPRLVGYCRPIASRDYLSPERWEIAHRNAVTRFGMSSEVVVASRRDLGGESASPP